MSANEYVVISPEEFDFANVVYGPVDVKKYKSGDVINTQIYYLDPKGAQKKLLIKGLKRRTFGPNGKFPLGAPFDSPLSMATGLTAMYPLTSDESALEPTDEEQTLISVISALEDGVKDYAQSVAEDPNLPGNVRSSLELCVMKDSWDKFIKPTFMPAGPDKKGVTRAAHFYPELITFGKNESMKCLTKYYGPGNKPQNPIKYMGVMGELEPLLCPDRLFWGSHGKTPYVCSVKWKIVQANFTPTSSSFGVPTEQLLGSNDAPESLDIGEDYTPAKKVVQSEGFDDDDTDVSSLVASKPKAGKEEAPSKATPAKSKATPAKAPSAVKVVSKATPAKATPVKVVSKATPAKAPSAAKVAPKATPAKVVAKATPAKVVAKATPAKAKPVKKVEPEEEAEEEEEPLVNFDDEE